MAVTIEQQRALAMAAAKAAADQAGSAAVAPADPGNPVLNFIGDRARDVGNAFQTEAQNTDWSNPLQAASDKLSAGFTSGVNALPFVGPKALEGLERFKAGVQGRSYEDVAASDQAQVEQHPVSSAAGTTAGVVLPFAVGAGEGGLAARLLGMEGSLPSRIGLGALSSGLIEGGDAVVARGDDPMMALGKGLTAAAFGGAFPIVERGVGSIARSIMGRSAPQQARSVSRALRDDGVPVDEIPQRLAALGPDARIMDLGPNLQAQAGAIATVPGPGQRIVRDAVAQRGRGATARVENDVAQTVGRQPDVEGLRQQIVDAQSRAADPLYAAIRQTPITAPPILRSILQRPMGQQAIRRAVDMAANDGYHFPVTGNVMTVGLADYMKRALDDIASSARRGGENNSARQAGNMARAITGAVDRIVPAYRQARDAFAGPAQVLDAIEAGATVFSKETSPPQLQRMLAGMSPSERDALLQGARSQIEGMMGNAVNDVSALRNTFRKGWNTAKLRILLGNGVADDLLQRIDREMTYGQTANSVASNSETARRQASQAEVSPTIGTASQPQKTLIGLVLDAFNGARNMVEGVRRPEINAAMARLHTTGANQLSPATLRQLANGARATAPSLIAPAVPALLQEKARGPISITVRGGGPG